MKTATLLRVVFLAAVLTGCSTGDARRAALDAPNADVAGTWTGNTTADGNAYPVTLTLQQTGTDVAGEIRIAGRPDVSGRVQGKVQGEVLTITRTTGPRPGGEI